MSFPKYPQYKKSGIRWLGEVPFEWKLGSLKHLLRIRGGQDYKAVESFSQGGIPVIGSGGQFTYATDYLYDGESVLLGRKGTIDRPLYVSGKFWTVDTMFYTEVLKGTDGRFAYYAATTIPFALYSTSTALPSMSQFDLANHALPLPSKQEQTQIARFLDHETAQIDGLIEEQQRLIELLKEKRKAVISHAVTKGLDPNVPMKYSGVEWLGEVPAHWGVSKFGFLKTVLTDYTANGSFADLKSNVTYLDSPNFARLVRLTDLRKNLENLDGVWIDENAYKYLAKSALFGGEFLLANVGAYAGLFYKMPYGAGPASLAPNMFMAKFDEKKILPSFVSFAAIGKSAHDQLRLLATASSAQPKLNKDDFKSVIVALPTLQEQAQIVEFLGTQLSSFDALIAEAETGVFLLQERRSALISAAVTGKIDVRGWQPPAGLRSSEPAEEVV